MEDSLSIIEMGRMEGTIDFYVEEMSQTDLSSILCLVCAKTITVPYYRIAKIKKSMHKACAYLPRSMKHQVHPAHTIVIRNYNSPPSCDICMFVNSHVSFMHKISLAKVEGGLTYACETCSFRAHAGCLARKVPFHPHELKLIYSLPQDPYIIRCQICQQNLKGQNYLYHCGECSFFVHSYNCRPVKHSSHEHQLVLVEEATSTYSASGKCYGCGLKISPPYLFCPYKFCTSIFLHKHCSELAPVLEHHLHPAHTLTLFNRVKSDEPDRTCNACHLPFEGFTYSCAQTSCRFTLDTACAMKNLHLEHEFHEHHLKHEFHEHSLFSSDSKTSYECGACNLDHEGPSYQCSTCRFWVHQQCASLPKLRKIDWHPHELKLIYSIPKDSKHFHCHVCRKGIHPHSWAYHCAGCRFLTHVHNCSDPCRDVDLASAIHLPVANESVSLAKLFFMEANQEEVIEPEPQPRESNPTKTSQMFISYPSEGCDICVQLLAPPCNDCDQCQYILPESIPQLKDDCKYGIERLMASYESCHGFGISEAANGLNLKISSSVLPRYVNHEGHSHVLSTVYITEKGNWCNACDDEFIGYGFRCNICDFTIDMNCALLPGSIKHRYDDKDHPFKLTCFPVEGVEQNVCEICQEGITTRWFYHCEECVHSVHPRCIWKNKIRFGPFIQHDSTKHYITLVPTAVTHGFVCFVCHQKEVSDHGCSYSFFCEGCLEKVHLHCIPNHENMKRSRIDNGHYNPKPDAARCAALGEDPPTCLSDFISFMEDDRPDFWDRDY